MSLKQYSVKDEQELTLAFRDPIVCMHAKSLPSCLTLCNPMDCSHQSPLCMGLSRQEHWSGLPCPSPGDLPDPGTEPTSLMCAALADGFFITNPSGRERHE